MTDGFDPDKFNPHDPNFLADPYPTYASFRAGDPIYRVPLYSSDWMFRYADCELVLTATDTWLNNSPAGSPPGYGTYGVMASFPDGIFGSDPPLHTQLRSLLEPLLLDSITTAPALAATLAGPLLSAAAKHGRMELISDYALPLPAQVLFSLFGIPNDPGVWSGLMTWAGAIAAAHDATQSVGVRGAGATCSMALHSFFEGLRIRNAAAPGDGLFAKMCAAFEAAGLGPPEVQSCAVNFLVAGYLSTTFVLGTGVRNLLAHPDELAKLRADPTLAGSAVEEMLRIDGPVQVIDRYAAVDTEIDGRPYAQSAKVTAVVGAADHDPAVFADPDAFVIGRQDAKPHMGFGDGIHTCIGAPLVRLVAPVAINALIEQFPNLALDGIAQWQTDPYLRAVTSLPLRF